MFVRAHEWEDNDNDDDYNDDDDDDLPADYSYIVTQLHCVSCCS